MPESARSPRVLRVFISSPGDVADERWLARTAIEELMYDPFVRGRVTFEVVAWDVGPIRVPMLASQTPQSSVNDTLSRPSECDIVVVVLWGRMGTPLPAGAFRRADGSAYASGTEWEFEDAVSAAEESGTPAVLVYRRTSPVLYDLAAPDAVERARQLAAVDAFFARMLDTATGAILRGVNEYAAPADFRRIFEAHLRELVYRLVGPGEHRDEAAMPPVWSGSPFPGLRAFTSADEPIFYGRDRQTDALIAKVQQDRFVAVVGASGSGKSSLVGAGLVPRVAGGALEGSERWWVPKFEPQLRQWTGLFFTPAELGPDPFVVLAQRLAPTTGERVGSLADRLRADPSAVTEAIRAYCRTLGTGAQALVVVDQFDELFTLVEPQHRSAFIDVLDSLSGSQVARVVVTLRSDFYPVCLEHPGLARLLLQGHLPLAAPTDDLLDMVVRPAARAGVEFESGLPGRILTDAGRTSGTLPLLAYTLDELYRRRDESGRLTSAAYDSLGGVAGAIGARADEVFSVLPPGVRDTFRDVFVRLVDVTDDGHPTRRRVPLQRAGQTSDERALIATLTDARLLEVGQGEDGQPVVSVAHEALFSSWPQLAELLESVRADLLVLRRAAAAAAEWEASGRDESYLWPQERLEPVERALEALHPSLDAAVMEFLQPEPGRLVARLQSADLPLHQRQALADRLVELGPASIAGLVSCLTSPSPDVRGTAAAALARLGDAPASAVAPVLHHADAEVRLAAVAALANPGASATSLLLPLLSDQDDRVRSAAAGILEHGEGPGRAAALASMAKGDVDDRWRAAGRLGTLGADGVGPLVGLAADPDPRIRQAARLAVQALGTTAVGPLVAELRRGDQERRAAARELLAAVGTSALPAVLETAHEPALRDDVQAVLAAMGPVAVPALLDAARADSAGSREVAVAALVEIGTMAALFGLVERGLVAETELTS